MAGLTKKYGKREVDFPAEGKFVKICELEYHAPVGDAVAQRLVAFKEVVYVLEEDAKSVTFCNRFTAEGVADSVGEGANRRYSEITLEKDELYSIRFLAKSKFPFQK